MKGSLNQGLLGDIYTRQLYIGAEDFETKLLTRREIVALIQKVQFDLTSDLGKLQSNATILNNLADNSTNILNAANRTFSLSYADDKLLLNGKSGSASPWSELASVSIHIPKYSLSYSNSDNTITLNKGDGNYDTVSLKGVQIFDLCNYYDLTNFYIQK